MNKPEKKVIGGIDYVYGKIDKDDGFNICYDILDRWWVEETAHLHREIVRLTGVLRDMHFTNVNEMDLLRKENDRFRKENDRFRKENDRLKKENEQWRMEHF